MGLLGDLTAYLSEPSSAPTPAAQQTAKANELVNDVIGPWILEGGIFPPINPSTAVSPLLYNVGGLPMVIQGMMSPPAGPIVPPPGQILIQSGITMLFAAMPFLMGAPYLPGAIGNTGPNVSAAPAVPFIIPPSPPGVPPAGVAQLWVTNLMLTAASVMVSGIDVFPGITPIPTPWVFPFIPASPS